MMNKGGLSGMIYQTEVAEVLAPNKIFTKNYWTKPGWLKANSKAPKDAILAARKPPQTTAVAAPVKNHLPPASRGTPCLPAGRLLRGGEICAHGNFCSKKVLTRERIPAQTSYTPLARGKGGVVALS